MKKKKIEVKIGLKDLASVQHKLEMAEDMIEQIIRQHRQEIVDLREEFDQKMEGIIDHLTVQESSFLRKITSGLDDVGKKPSNAALLATIQGIRNLVKEKEDEIDRGTIA